MRLVIQPRSPDMRGRGMLEELFFGRVLYEPGDGAQPARVTVAPAPGPRASSSPGDVAGVMIGRGVAELVNIRQNRAEGTGAATRW